jgi:hypothetical protein
MERFRPAIEGLEKRDLPTAILAVPFPDNLSGFPVELSGEGFTSAESAEGEAEGELLRPAFLPVLAQSLRSDSPSGGLQLQAAFLRMPSFQQAIAAFNDAAGTTLESARYFW